LGKFIPKHFNLLDSNVQGVAFQISFWDYLLIHRNTAIQLIFVCWSCNLQLCWVY
jgi:hypothetical protein